MENGGAILFDLDDTLIQESAVVGEAFLRTARLAAERHGVDAEHLSRSARRSARELWLAHPDHDYAHRIGISSWEALWARFLGEQPEVRRFREWAPGYRRAAWRAGLEALGVYDDALAGELSDRFVEQRRELHRPYPETRAVLGMLRERGQHRLGLLTNGLPCLQREKIHGAGLEPYFDAICVSGDVGMGKPDPRPFELLLEQLETSAHRASMVGDNPERDILGAQAAGLTAIWIDRGVREPVEGVVPDLRITTLEELPQLPI
jgi:putative hydrolase of the HAD superfamily